MYYKGMIRSVSAKELLNKHEIKPFLLGVLFSRIMPKPIGNSIPEYFYGYTWFKASKAVYKTDFNLVNYAGELVKQYNSQSGFEIWTIDTATESQVKLKFYIKNDLDINSAQFYNLIYQKLLQSKWLAGEDVNEDKKSFIRGYMETRGSIDTSAKFISQDYFYNNSLELKRVQLLTDMIGLPIAYANFNPRNMQPQFVSGENKRNAQFRINIFYYAKEIGFINEYKAMVFENAYYTVKKDIYSKNGIKYYVLQVPEINDDVTFIKYLQFFTNNIYKKELDVSKIEELRKRLGFKDKKSGSFTKNRDKSIIDIFRNVSENKCALCGVRKTFTNENEQEYFEIHHMIPYHNGIQYDNIANLVKLCPTCHTSLKKGRASKQTQIDNITKILTNNELVFQYTCAALGEDDIHTIAQRIYELLG